MNAFEEGYFNKLKNKLYGLLCEFEKEGKWEEYLDSIYLEVMGLTEQYKTINYYILLAKLGSLKYVKYKYFRSIIFDCMSLISKGGFDNELL